MENRRRLGKGLEELFNINSHPQLILEGIIEDKLPAKVENTYGKYFFFGGALLPRYGIYQLIQSPYILILPHFFDLILHQI